MFLIHIFSPIIYYFFFKSFKFIPSCPNSSFMLLLRKLHNIFLSLLSFYMFLGIITVNYYSNKYKNIEDILCKPYNINESDAVYYLNLFLYSKYLEWLDTLFLHLGNNKISTLQYTHHMSTAILVYLNKYPEINPSISVFYILNTFIHIWMYLYFAFPSKLLRYKIFITKFQIFQHIISLLTIIITLFVIKDCNKNLIGNYIGFSLYSMYLFYFVKFYFNKYF